MAIETNGILGGAGACLIVTGVISAIFSVIGLTMGNTNIDLGISEIFVVLLLLGFLLYFVSLYGLSKDYRERNIFRHIRNGVIAVLITGTAGTIIVEIIPYTYHVPQRIVNAVALLILAIFTYQSFKLLGDKTGARLFRVTGKLLIVSEIIDVTVIVALVAMVNVFGIDSVAIQFALLSPGVFMQYAAWAFTAKGFFAIKPPTNTGMTDQPRQVMFCPNCGERTKPVDVYCVKCGNKLE